MIDRNPRPILGVSSLRSKNHGNVDGKSRPSRSSSSPAHAQDRWECRAGPPYPPHRPLDQTACRWQLPRYNGHSCLRASRQVLGRSGRRSINKSTAIQVSGFSIGNRRAVQANHRFDRQITAVNNPSLRVGKFERTSRVRPEMDGHVVQTPARFGSSGGASFGSVPYRTAVEKIASIAFTRSCHRQTVVLTGRGMFDFPARKNELKDGATPRVCACPKSSPVRLDD